MASLTKEEATAFFARHYNGEHHIPGYDVKQFGYGWCIHHDRGEMSTYDFDQLTRLVIAAHDDCIRVGIDAIRNGIIRIAIWKRERIGGMSESHPTIEQAIERFRNKI